MIERLLTVLTFGIAATVNFALCGTASSAAVSAQPHAKSVEVAAEAFHDDAGNTGLLRGIRLRARRSARA
jgi:hypothetical protein